MQQKQEVKDKNKDKNKDCVKNRGENNKDYKRNNNSLKLFRLKKIGDNKPIEIENNYYLIIKKLQKLELGWFYNNLNSNEVREKF